jgi:hypothetical protein
MHFSDLFSEETRVFYNSWDLGFWEVERRRGTTRGAVV